jgi:hypothetical protein
MEQIGKVKVPLDYNLPPIPKLEQRTSSAPVKVK